MMNTPSHAARQGRRKFLLNWLAVVIAVVSALIAYRAFSASNKVARVQVYLQLKDRYFEIQAKLPPAYKDNDWNVCPNDEENWNAIRRYWYHCFDEWFVTTKLNGGEYQDLWDAYYSHAIQSALAYRPLRIVACNLVNGGSSFSGFADEFGAVLEDLYKSGGDGRGSLEEGITCDCFKDSANNLEQPQQNASRESSPREELGRQNGLYANLWMQTSAEYEAICREIFASALAYIKGAKREGVKQAVIIDLDETVISNAAFDSYLAFANREWSDRLWEEWIKCGADHMRLVPGARRFIDEVRALGFQIIFVSDRSTEYLDVTRQVLRRLGVQTARSTNAPQPIFLLRADKEDTKQARVARVVKSGLETIAYLGDNLGDFPYDFDFGDMSLEGRKQKVREQDPGALLLRHRTDEQQGEFWGLLATSWPRSPVDSWGRGWFVFPNPAYGTWLKLVDRKDPYRNLEIWSR